MTLIQKRLLQSDIKNFILSDNITNVYRENLLDDILEDYFSVSYTHLTLPTKRIV